LPIVGWKLSAIKGSGSTLDFGKPLCGHFGCGKSIADQTAI
jgi:hypothetical protein